MKISFFKFFAVLLVLLFAVYFVQSFRWTKITVADINVLKIGPTTGAGTVTHYGPASFSGNVGIGTTATGYNLNVNGTGNFATSLTVAGVTGGVIPSGAVMFFNLASCPSGWSALTAAQGRYIVGLPSGGTLVGTVGTAMTDKQNITHTHTFTPAGSVSSTFSGSGGTTGSGGVDHTHTFTPAGSVSSSFSGSGGTTGSGGVDHTHTGPSHTHAQNGYSIVNYTDQQVGIYASGTSGQDMYYNSPGSGGGTSYRMRSGVQAAGTSNTGGASAYLHTHSFTPAGSVSSSFSGSGGTTSASSAYLHTHTFTPAGSVSSTFSGSGGTTGASAGTDAPYIQLLVCQKS